MAALSLMPRHDQCIFITVMLHDFLDIILFKAKSFTRHTSKYADIENKHIDRDPNQIYYRVSGHAYWNHFKNILLCQKTTVYKN